MDIQALRDRIFDLHSGFVYLPPIIWKEYAAATELPIRVEDNLQFVSFAGIYVYCIEIPEKRALLLGYISLGDGAYYTKRLK